MTELVLSAGLVTQLLLIAVVWHLFARAYRVLTVYSKGWTWCVVKTLKGTKVEGWVSVVTLRSLGSRTFVEMPAVLLKNSCGNFTFAPTELDSIHEITGLFRVAWRSGGYGLES